MRVMLSLPEDDHDARAVAILHDAVERGNTTLSRLRRAIIPARIIRGVELMTHDKSKASYAEYVVKLKPNRLARAVKLADLRDNANLHNVTFRVSKADKDKKRVIRYALSYKFLTDQITVGQFRELMRDAE
ncbi:MAG TPA: hypothetical protein VL282_11835 [Tepidisphaeraceae bacterium]|nr:hypothetical protein [Tepidisphaeraceae bacterium]